MFYIVPMTKTMRHQNQLREVHGAETTKQVRPYNIIAYGTRRLQSFRGIDFPFSD